MKIRKAIIPVAGKGTRFLPATKAIPKEMIPILKRPMIDYVVDEAISSGIEQVIFVTSAGKESIENYFDRNLEYEAFLNSNGKTKEAEYVRSLGERVEVVSVRQKQQLGLGHAVLCAANLVGEENFAVLLGDDLIRGQTPVTKQLIDISSNLDHCPVIGVMEIDPSETGKYGIIDGLPQDNHPGVHLMREMIEKPAPDVAPSNLATPGRYVFTPEIFDYLRKIKRGVGGEYQLTDAINMYAKEKKVYSYQFTGERFDTGNVHGHLRAIVEFALMDQELNPFMKEIIGDVKTKYNF